MADTQGFEDRFVERLHAYAAPAARPPHPDAVAKAVAAGRDARRGVAGWLRWPTLQLLSYGAVAALALLAVVLAYGVWGGGGIGPAAPSLPPSPTPSPRPLPPGGPLDPGTYLYPSGRFAPVAFTFTVPDGWVVQNGGWNINKNVDLPGELGFGSSIVGNIYSDACAEGPELVDAGSTVDDLVNALLDQSGPVVDGPFDVTVGGYSGKRLVLSPPPAVEDCRLPGGLQVWLDQAGNYSTISDGSASVYIIDVDGNRLVLSAGHHHASPAADVAELEAIIESIDIQP